jgi:tetratricopeptide (TPR) repeat protein
VRGAGEQATQILAGVLFQGGKLDEALAVLDHAARWYTRAEQWLGFGGIADAAADHARAERAFARAYALDETAFDATQLDAYARALHALARYDDAVRMAERAIARNTNKAAASSFALTLEQAQLKAAPTFNESPRPSKVRHAAFAQLDAGDHASAAALLGERDWKARRAALAAARHRTASEYAVAVTARADRAAATTMVTTIGSLDPDAVLCRMTAMAIREQAAFARDPSPRFPRPAPAASAAPRLPDRVVVQGSKVARVADYVALLRDLAALAPREALQQFDLDDAGYLEVARAWGAALDADPALAADVAAGLARR